MESFKISIPHRPRALNFTVERFDVTPVSEKFKVIGRNKSILLSSNRPLFRNKGLKHRIPDFKILSDNVQYAGSIDVLFTAILQALEPKKQA